MPPEDSIRPKLHTFRRGNRFTKIETAAAIGVSPIQVGRYELPFGDPARQIPREEVMERIFEWSRGEVTPADFYPARLAAEPAQ